MSLSPPSEGYFPSYDALVDHARTHAFSYGYAVSIKRSERDKFVCLQCDRGGNYSNRLNLTNKTCQRATSTRLIGCHFELYGKKIEDGQWYLKINNKEHNYEASEEISGHPSSRQLNKEDQQKVKEMSKAGIYPREILSTLRQRTQII